MVKINKPNKDDDLMRKILNPTTKQDIYDTIPNAKAIFEGPAVHVAKTTHNAKLINDRAARIERLRTRAQDAARRTYERNLAAIEKNIK